MIATIPKQRHNVRIDLEDARTGQVLGWVEYHNEVLFAGLRWLLQSKQNDHANAGQTLRFFAIGTGLSTPTLEDVALETEIFRKEIAEWTEVTDGTTSPLAGPETTAILRLLENEANGTLSEGALTVNASGPPLFTRGVFGRAGITGATQANPVVITSVDHGLTNDIPLISRTVRITAVNGMTQINDRNFTINALDADTFELVGENGTGHDSYTSGGFWNRVLLKTTAHTATIRYGLETIVS